MGLVSSIVAAVRAKRAANEQKKKAGIIEQHGAEDTALFNRQYFQDMSKRSDVQNIFRNLDQGQKKADTRTSAQGAVMGATPEQLLAGQEVNRRAYADSVADLASNASRLRDQYAQNYQNQRSKYFAERLGMQDQLAAIENNMAKQWSQAGVGAFQAGGNLLAQGLGSLKTPVGVPPQGGSVS